MLSTFSRFFSTKVHNLIIAGSGPAGSTAALYAARAGLDPLVFYGSEPGGQLTTTSVIENFPGWTGTGPDLVLKIEEQATQAGAKYSYDHIEDCDLKSPIKKIKTDCGEYLTKALIIATGASAKYLGVPGEDKFKGNGVSACAVCDGPLFRGKNVVVVGGGDSAVEEALFLNKMCKSVKMIVRKNELNASAAMIEKIKKANLEIIWNRTVEQVLGDKKVEGVALNCGSKLVCDGVFVAIGRNPATNVFRKWLSVDKNGYFVTNGSPATDIPGVFVAGDCADPHYRQAITAAGAGCQAALLAERYITKAK